MKNFKKGFVIPLLIIIAAALVVGGGIYLYSKKIANQQLASVSASKQVVPTGTSGIKFQALDMSTNAPVYSARVSLYNSSGALVSSRGMRRGVAGFSGLSAGDYKITVQNQGYIGTSVNVTLTDSKTTRVVAKINKVTFNTFVGNPPRSRDGSINLSALSDLETRLNMSYYTFFPQPNRGDALGSDDYSKISNILSSTDAPVIVDLLGFNHASVAPFKHNYVSWARDIATKSLTQPNLSGINFDDFFASGQDGSFSDTKYLAKVCNAARDINPDIEIFATLYCTSGKSEINKFLDLMKSNRDINDCFSGAFVDIETEGYALPDLMIDSSHIQGQAQGRAQAPGLDGTPYVNSDNICHNSLI